jgi:hypothetical protein
MAENSADLTVEHPDKLPPDRHLDAEQLFDGQAEGVLLIHRRNVVEPIEIGHVLQIGARLHQLLGAAMQQADVRIDAFDHFAVQLQHQAQHAVRGRVLRAEVDVELADGLFGLGRGECDRPHSGLIGPEGDARLFHQASPARFSAFSSPGSGP